MTKKRTRTASVTKIGGARNRSARQARRRQPSSRATTAKRPAPLASGGTSDTDPEPIHTDGLTVVGIGASAGGLEATTRLLQHLRRDTNMAYVMVQHLAPHHESVLPELLRAVSGIPVIQVRDGMPLKANRVHVVPPNVEMRLAKGHLRLAPRPSDQSQYTPIDSFFQSLATAARSRAIGVVLSGSASDGAMGLREIKSHGGITIAQDPKSAKYDGMPRAAIATGAIDLILAPEAIAQELDRIADHPFVRAALPATTGTSFADQQFERLFQVLRGASGVDFSHYKLPTITRRLQRRMVLHKMSDLDDYLNLLDHDAAEARNLYRDILIHVTRFFREPESFAALKETVFPKIIKDAAGKRPIRIWVPGCSTGEEAYSVAIALLEFLGGDASRIPIQVFGTDVSEEAIDKARQGLYPESIVADVSPDRLRRFFSRVDGQLRVTKLVRDSCIFARQDLTRDPPFSKLDLIVCRNVLIYLGTRLQHKLISVFHYALKTSGFLMLGSTESVGRYAELFVTLDKRHKIHSKRAGHVRTEFELTHSGPVAEHRERLPVRVYPQRSARSGDIQSEINRALVGRYSPPAVVVDHNFHIVHTKGKTGPYLELASGDPSLNLLKMAREGLLHGLRSALQEARKSRKPARREGLAFRSNGGTREVDLQVLPILDSSESVYFLVLFETPEPGKASKGVQPSEGRAEPRDRRYERLQQELTTSRDYMQSIIQDLEAANEELQSANEEILSSNEELQSTNEELDTAKEELQSTNEELNTVNDELNARNEELSLVNADLVNLLTAVPAAVVIVAADLRIRRFTPTSEPILNLIPTDVGRPLSDIKTNLDIPDLASLTLEVIDTVAVKELEATDRSGRRYAVRIRPYKNQDHKIDGAVLAFAARDDAMQAHTGYDSIDPIHDVVGAINTGVLILTDELQVLAANATVLKYLGASLSAIQGQHMHDIAHGQLQNSPLMKALTRLRMTRDPIDGLAVDLTNSNGHRLIVDGRRADTSPSHSPWIVLTVRERGTE